MRKPILHIKTRFLLLAMIFASAIHAQEFQKEIQTWLQQAKTEWRLTDADIANWVVSDQYANRQTGITYTYLHQQVSGIRIFNAVSTLALRDGKVIHFANRFLADAAGKINATQPALDQQQAIAAAAAHLGLTLKETPRQLTADANRLRTTWTRGSIAQKDIMVELIYLTIGKNLRLAWNVNLAPIGSADWWNIRIDALTGQYLEKNNWTTHCDFGVNHAHDATCGSKAHKTDFPAEDRDKHLNAPNYNVYALPAEAPLYGDRSLLTDPHSPVASPYGWHDDNGADGPEYTITRGNNVYTYEDRANNNEPGYAPDGGADLNFDFIMNPNVAPAVNQDAVLTNLFYMNNMLHDILYIHGFDERSGNFQAHNYGNGGLADDYVLAEGQDGGGTNNANFSTPEDGGNGRMQMYLWPAEIPVTLTVLSPEGIAGDYEAVEAAFGPGVTEVITEAVVLVNDDTAPVTDACEVILNGAELAGKIAIVDRGTCSFISKVNALEAQGAIAVIVCNNTDGTPISMGGSGNSNIPAVMISKADGELIKARLVAGETVEVTLQPAGGASGQDRDGSLDNGIIAHEYGHGLSTRLTGGPSNSNCLFNGEQGGEGWSDWLGLILTIEPGDNGTDTRGIGVYALNDDSGQGIRRYPYSTDMSVNPQTYGSLAGSVGPHAVGEIWSSVLWEMTWELMEAEGFDPDWYNGVGGNNTAMRLVIEAMKLQPCSPGYLDARDAILKADEVLYENAHRCLIWEAFAKRGMGVHAIQGSSGEVGDEVEDFTLPNLCLTATIAPTAAFEVDASTNCSGNFNFKDLSTDIPQYWLWDFGDGNTSEAESPSHSYTTPGTYTVILSVTNNIGTDTDTIEVIYAPLTAPTVSGGTTVCEGGAALLTADVDAGNTAIWSLGGSVVHTGTSFLTPEINAPVTYSVQQTQENPILHTGAPNNAFGTGGNHNTGFDGQLWFETFRPLKIVSVLVYAQGASNRTIRLLNEAGEEIESLTTLVPAGPSRVALDMEIPVPGKYRLANVSENLYRNNSGADYPYAIDDLISIYSSNATDDELNFYYYFYDWEVQETSCLSEAAEVELGVVPGPVAGFGTEPDNLTVNFTDESTGSPTSWQWNFGDGSPAGQQQNPVHAYTEDGIYTVELTVSNGNCSSTYRQEVEVGATNANEPDALASLKLYPNPAGEQVYLEFRQPLSAPVDVLVTDATGRLVLSQRHDAGLTRIAVSAASLAPGAYQFRVTGEQGTWVRTVAIVR